MSTVTECYNRLHELTVQQENAIDLLVSGQLDARVAEAVGVHRVTVTRWRNYHPAFQAELNRRRQEIWGASTDRLKALLPLAFDALERELTAGTRNRSRVALQVLKLAGLDSREPPDGPTDSTAIIEQQVDARAEFLILQGEQYLSDTDRLSEMLDASVRQRREEAIRQIAREELLHELDGQTTDFSPLPTDSPESRGEDNNPNSEVSE